MAVEHSTELDGETASARDRMARRHPPDRPIATVGRRYSRFVGFMKVFLPSLTVVIVGALAIWPMLGDKGEPVVTQLQKQPDILQVTRPLLVGTDKNQRRYSIAASRAQQGSEGPHIVELSNPDGKLIGSDGATIALRAATGRFDRNRESLLLRGNVRISRDDGHLFVTDEAHIDMNIRSAWGDRPVFGEGPSGQIRAQGFRIEDDGATVIFTGRSRAILTGAPDAAGTSDDSTAPEGDAP